MNFEEFKDTFATDVKDTLERRSGSAYEVESRKVDKMNESYEALTVKQQDQIIGVNLNLDSLYRELDDGADYGVLVSKAKQITCRIFFAKVLRLMGWSANYKYKVLGKLIRTDTDQIFVFDFK